MLEILKRISVIPAETVLRAEPEKSPVVELRHENHVLGKAIIRGKAGEILLRLGPGIPEGARQRNRDRHYPGREHFAKLGARLRELDAIIYKENT
jgi:hypothetical protein